MKTFNFFWSAAIIIFTLSITGCVGDEGPMGAQGIPGLDGTMFYSGNTPPTSDIGKD